MDKIVLLQILLVTASATTLPVAAVLCQRRRLEQEARTARDAAERSNRAKSEFLAGISHELRTPLNAVIGFSEMIVKRSGWRCRKTRKYREYAHDIRDSGGHLLEMINELLDMAKIESGRA